MLYTFAKTIQHQMEAKKLGLKDVATRIGCSSEHVRKLCASEAFPSRTLQDALAKLLQLDGADFAEQVKADRWRRKFGKIPTTGAAQEQHPIYAVWDELTKAEQAVLLCAARCMVKQKKRKAA